MGFTVYIRREDMRSFDASLARLPDFDNVTADSAAARQPGADSSSPARLRLGLGLLRRGELDGRVLRNGTSRIHHDVTRSLLTRDSQDGFVVASALGARECACCGATRPQG